MKKIKWIRLIGFTLLGIVLLFGVMAIFYRHPRFVRVGKPELVSVQDSFVNLRLSMTVQNPNFFSISGKHITMQFAEGVTTLGEGLVENMSIPRFAETDVTVEVKANVNQVIRSYRQHSSDTVSPSVAVKGSFMPFFFLHEFNIHKEIPKNELYALLFRTFQSGDGARVDSFRIKRASLLESQVDFTILFTNKYNIDFEISSIAAQVYPDKKMNILMGSVETKRNIPFRSGSTIAIPLQLNIKNFSLLRAMVENGVKQLKTVYIQGEARLLVDNTLIPVPFEIPVGRIEQQDGGQ